MYIGGQWVTTAERQTVELPYDGSPVGACYKADAALVAKAIESAHQGAKLMRALTNYERADLLVRITAIVKRDLADFADSHLPRNRQTGQRSARRGRAHAANPDRIVRSGAATSRRSDPAGRRAHRQRPHGNDGARTSWRDRRHHAVQRALQPDDAQGGSGAGRPETRWCISRPARRR